MSHAGGETVNLFYRAAQEGGGDSNERHWSNSKSESLNGQGTRREETEDVKKSTVQLIVHSVVTSPGYTG